MNSSATVAMQAKEDYCQTRESPQYKLMGELQLNQFSVQKTQQSTPIQLDGGEFLAQHN